MKQLIPLALVVFALVAVPAALADGGDTTATGTIPTAPASPADGGQRFDHLRARVKVVAHRFNKRCGKSTDAPQRCIDRATKIAERLAKLEANVQARIAKIREACAAATTDERCKNADKRVARLQKLDERIKALQLKVQDWLNGKSTATDDSALDDAASDLGQLVGSNG